MQQPTTSSSLPFTPDQIRRRLADYNSQVRLGVIDGNIRQVMRELYLDCPRSGAFLPDLNPDLEVQSDPLLALNLNPTGPGPAGPVRVRFRSGPEPYKRIKKILYYSI